MSHHSSEPDENIRRMFGELGLGATGEFPEGKLTQTDEGEIQMAVGVHNGKIVIDFGKPTQWVGMNYEQAMALSGSLRDKAFATRGIK